MVCEKLSPYAMLLIAVFLSACVAQLPPIQPNPTSSVRSVAILPMVNNTNDIDGPVVVRELFTNELNSYYYIIKPLNETDQILKDQMGVTLGSQLDMAKPQQLGEKLGVDAVIYSSLEDFSAKVTGVYNVKRVRLRVKMVDCKTGQTIWKNGIGVKKALRAGGGVLGKMPGLGLAFAAAGAVSSIGSGMSDKDADLPHFMGEDIKAPWHVLPEESSSIEGSLISGVGERVVSKAMNSPLRPETEAATSILLHGYYHTGGFGKPVDYGTMIPRGPGGAAAVQVSTPRPAK